MGGAVKAGMFELIGQNIWTHEAVYRLGALAIPHRVTVMAGQNGGLVVHSPARPDDATRAALARLGRVGAVIFPSWWHDLYLRDWADTYPDAALWVAPGLRRAARDLKGAVQLDERSPVDGDVDAISIDGLGVWMNEFVFFHRPSRTLIVADLVVNVRHDLPQPARAFFTVLGAYPAPRIPWYYTLVARDRRRLRATLDRILAWDFDALVVGHGDVIARGAHAVFGAAAERLMHSGRERNERA